MPVWWGKNQSGMQAKEELDSSEKNIAQLIWLAGRDKAIECVKEMSTLGLHKQIANRMLEPWFNIRIILTGTEFDNFFMLRCHPDAQPEIQALAYKMRDLYRDNEPKKLHHGEWHVPFGDKISVDRVHALGGNPWSGKTQSDIVKIAVARCARVSYFNFEGKDDYAADIKLCDRLFASEPKHLSPTEHVAQCMDGNDFIANFRGWKQYRKLLEGV